MPTAIESIDNRYTYCERFDVHCPCIKCTVKEDEYASSNCRGRMECDTCAGWRPHAINSKGMVTPLCEKGAEFDSIRDSDINVFKDNYSNKI